MRTALPARSAGRKRTERPDADQAQGAQLLIDPRYGNELPKPPVPKLLRAMPSVDSLCRYKPTLLELDHRPLLVSERELLSCMDYVDPTAYGELPAASSMPPPPPPVDAQLLRDDDVGEEVRIAQTKRARLTEQTEAYHREAFGLQLPQLVTNDVFTERQRYTVGMEASEKKLYREPPPDLTIADLVAKVEETFQAAKRPPVHPTNPALRPKRILPIVPDAALWTNRYRQVVFDEAPEELKVDDILFKTVPTPRATCFGHFREDEQGYRLQDNYFWDNRGRYNRSLGCDEGDAVLLSMPASWRSSEPVSEAEAASEEALFVPMPTWMRIKKQKAQRLDIELETKFLQIRTREPTEQEQVEERGRMRAVLTDEYVGETEDESTIEYVGGEWVTRAEQEAKGAGSGVEDARSPAGSAGTRSGAGT